MHSESAEEFTAIAAGRYRIGKCIVCVCVCVYIASYPDVQKGGGNAWYTLFAHALNLLLDNCIMDASDVDIWAGFC